MRSASWQHESFYLSPPFCLQLVGHPKPNKGASAQHREMPKRATYVHIWRGVDGVSWSPEPRQQPVTRASTVVVMLAPDSSGRESGVERGEWKATWPCGLQLVDPIVFKPQISVLWGNASVTSGDGGRKGMAREGDRQEETFYALSALRFQQENTQHHWDSRTWGSYSCVCGTPQAQGLSAYCPSLVASLSLFFFFRILV